MQLDITPEWRIVSDPNQWVVQRQKVVKGVSRWEPEAYLTDLHAAVNWLWQRMLRDSPARGPVQALAEAEQLATTLTRALSPLFEVTLIHHEGAGMELH